MIRNQPAPTHDLCADDPYDARAFGSGMFRRGDLRLPESADDPDEPLTQRFFSSEQEVEADDIDEAPETVRSAQLGPEFRLITREIVVFDVNVDELDPSIDAA